MLAKSLLATLLVPLTAQATVDSFLVKAQSTSAVTRTQFRQTMATAHRLFAPLSAIDNRKLEFYSDWNQDWAQAFARRWETDQVIIYGGIARIANGTMDSFALIVCHELGHLYGGLPQGDTHNRISVEGQADYWATSYCWDKLAAEIPSTNPDIKDRGVKAALVVTAFYAANRNIAAPKVSTPDLTEVESTVMTHPEPQCRLDTYLAGLESKPRPRCWFKGE